MPFRRPGLIVLLAFVAFGCARSEEVAWQPVTRLADHLEAPLPPGTPERCSVADEIRRSFGCPPLQRVLRATYPFPEESQFRIRVPLPAPLDSGLAIIEPVMQGKDVDGWREIGGPMLLGGAHPEIELTLPLSELKPNPELRVQIDGISVPPKPESFRTRELMLGRKAMLRLGLGIAPLGVKAGASAAEFVVTAESEAGAEEVLRAVVTPEESRQGWVDRRVDLSRYAGKKIRLAFSSTVAPGASAQEGEVFSLPLWGSPEILEPLPRRGQRNIVLVSLDTLRGDLVGATLAGRKVTPELDRIAAEGAKFTQAIAPYPSTTASHMSLFTGVYPAVHKVLHAKHTLPETIPTLSEILASNGYLTAAVTENGMLAAEAGFVRGFDDYIENKGVSMWDAPGDVDGTVAKAVSWLQRNRDTKFFLFVHTYQVHNPYEPPEEYDVFKGLPSNGQSLNLIRMRRRYAGEVHFTDTVLRNLFATLDRLGEADDTIVVLTSDHGEEFGEHGSVGHSQGVYDEVLRVPLIVWAPGLVPPGLHFDGQVSLLDLPPTILDLADLATPSGLQGESLAPALRGTGSVASNKVRFAEGPILGNAGGRLFSARTGRYKWITRENDESTLQVFDLQADPGEKKSLDDPKLREQGKELLSIYKKMDVGDVPAGANPTRDIDARTESKLRALGYLD